MGNPESLDSTSARAPSGAHRAPLQKTASISACFTWLKTVSTDSSRQNPSRPFAANPCQELRDPDQTRIPPRPAPTRTTSPIETRTPRRSPWNHGMRAGTPAAALRLCVKFPDRTIWSKARPKGARKRAEQAAKHSPPAWAPPALEPPRLQAPLPLPGWWPVAGAATSPTAATPSRPDHRLPRASA